MMETVSCMNFYALNILQASFRDSDVHKNQSCIVYIKHEWLLGKKEQ
jgi:hypothetical protein